MCAKQATKKKARNILSADQILEGVECHEVHVPELGGYVLLKPSSIEDVLSYTELESGAESNARMIEMVGEALVTESGERLFTPEQLKRFGRTNARAFVRIQQELNELNSIETDEADVDTQAEQERLQLLAVLRHIDVPEAKQADAIIYMDEYKKDRATAKNG